MDEFSNIFGGTEQLWQYIRKYASKAGREATRVVLELYYVVKSPHTPALDKALIIAALGYQLLPDDRTLFSREKYGLLGLLDNGAALALAYNRVKTRVTPQIEAQVDAILNQWFGPEQPEIVKNPETPQNTNDNDLWELPSDNTPTVPVSPAIPSFSNTPLDSNGDDEDVVID